MTFETVYNTILYHYDVQLTGIQFVVLLLSVQYVYFRKYVRLIKSSKAFAIGVKRKEKNLDGLNFKTIR